MMVGQRHIVPFHIDRCQDHKARGLDEAGPPRAPQPHRLFGTRACAAASRPFGTRPSNSARAGTGRTSSRRPPSGRTCGTAAARWSHAHWSTFSYWASVEQLEDGAGSRKACATVAPQPNDAATGMRWKFPRNSVGRLRAGLVPGSGHPSLWQPGQLAHVEQYSLPGGHSSETCHCDSERLGAWSERPDFCMHRSVVCVSAGVSCLQKH